MLCDQIFGNTGTTKTCDHKGTRPAAVFSNRTTQWCHCAPSWLWLSSKHWKLLNNLILLLSMFKLNCLTYIKTSAYSWNFENVTTLEKCLLIIIWQFICSLSYRKKEFCFYHKWSSTAPADFILKLYILVSVLFLGTKSPILSSQISMSYHLQKSTWIRHQIHQYWSIGRDTVRLFSVFVEICDVRHQEIITTATNKRRNNVSIETSLSVEKKS